MQTCFWFELAGSERAHAIGKLRLSFNSALGAAFRSCKSMYFLYKLGKYFHWLKNKKKDNVYLYKLDFTKPK